MFSDAALYTSRRQLQDRDSVEFVEAIAQKMEWREGDVVMDVGCGPGTSFRSLYLPAFPRVARVVGVDVSRCMVEFAREANAGEGRTEFHVADIEDRKSVERWFGQVTKVISIYCLHWLRNMEEGFRNIYHLLRPGGEAALLFALSCPVWDSYELLYANPKWRQYIEGVYPCVPESNSGGHATGHFCSLLEGVGFRVASTEYRERTYAYRDDEDCREFWYACCAFSNHIPEELADDFKEDLLKGFLQYNGRDSEGRLVMRYNTLAVLLKKPTEQRGGSRVV